MLFAYEDVLGPEGPASRTTLWTSRDGLAWSQVDLPIGLGGVESVSVGSLGAVAATCAMGDVGSSGSVGDAIWYSNDGLEWSNVDLPGGHVNPVIAVGEYGFVMTGGGLQMHAADGSDMRSVQFRSMGRLSLRLPPEAHCSLPPIRGSGSTPRRDPERSDRGRAGSDGCSTTMAMVSPNPRLIDDAEGRASAPRPADRGSSSHRLVDRPVAAHS